MIFASKTPRDLNHDPCPWRVEGMRTQTGVSVGSGDEWGTRVRDPRPEFDHVQHNEPNPILVAYREIGVGNVDAWLTATWALQMFGGYTQWNDERSFFHAFVRATAAQNLHARRVLERLAALSDT